MSSAQGLPAKVLKRMGQIDRLGPGGLARTAYVRALGPSFYLLSDPVRRMKANLHRCKAANVDLERRVEALQQRTAGLNETDGTHVSFGDELGRFVQTLEAMIELGARGCAVPQVIGVDWQTRTLIHEKVHEAAAGSHPLEQIEAAIVGIHRGGYALGKIGSGAFAVNAVGRLVVADLGTAIPLAGLSRDMSIHMRDEDSHRCNQLFGTHLLTAAQLRKLLSPSAGIPSVGIKGLSEVYAPVVIRDDIRWGKIWNTDLGVGRWNFIMKQHLPIPLGGRILDLGTNNGFNPLQMLREGAASAVGIEIHEPAVEQARFLKSAYEWLDNRAYDFRCIHASQADLPRLALPRFDVVTALCCLYYLRDAEIRELVRFIRTRTEVFVVQCNIDRLLDRGGNEETFRKASVEYNMEVLQEAGFPELRVIAPRGYSRPLIIARAA